MFLCNDMWAVPCVNILKKLIIDEFHKIAYSSHPRYYKMMTTLNKSSYYLGMEKDFSQYNDRCVEFQQVKVKCKHTEGLLQSTLILEWKCEAIYMEFVIGVLNKTKNHDAIIVVVGKLNKETHLIMVKSIHKAIDIAYIFMKLIFKLHGTPNKII